MPTIRVYRYLNALYGIEALQSQQLKIGRFHELNDPYDCQPQLINLGRRDHAADFARGYINRVGQQFGLLCYSTEIDDPVIWSHYAEGHHGLAIEFEYDLEGDNLRQVDYPQDNGRATVDFEQLQSLTTANDALLHMFSQGFMKKAKSWKYEHEYRQFIMLKGRMFRGLHYFFPILQHTLRSVVLGARCILSDIDIRNALKSVSLENFRISRAKMNPRYYRMDILDEST